MITSRTNLSACGTGRAPVPRVVLPVGAVMSTQGTHFGGVRAAAAAGSWQNTAALLGRTDQDARVTMPQQLHHHRALCHAAQAELVAITCPSIISATIRHAKAKQLPGQTMKSGSGVKAGGRRRG